MRCNYTRLINGDIICKIHEVVYWLRKSIVPNVFMQLFHYNVMLISAYISDGFRGLDNKMCNEICQYVVIMFKMHQID